MSNRSVSDYTATTCKRVGCKCQRLITVKRGEEDTAMCDGSLGVKKDEPNKTERWLTVICCLLISGFLFGVGFVIAFRLLLL